MGVFPRDQSEDHAMKPRHNTLEWQDNHRREVIPSEEVCHMFHLFHNTKWDGHRIFFIERLGNHTYRVTHVLGIVAVFHLEPVELPATHPLVKEPSHEPAYA